MIRNTHFIYLIKSVLWSYPGGNRIVEPGIDKYFSFVVIARSEEEARCSNPTGGLSISLVNQHPGWVQYEDRDQLHVTEIGIPCENMRFHVVICSRFIN